jgi:uncharacterized protein involved in exopolysaccharide biosynthesis
MKVVMIMKREGGEFLLLDGQMLSADETWQVIQDLRKRILVMQQQIDILKEDLRERGQILKSIGQDIDEIKRFM